MVKYVTNSDDKGTISVISTISPLPLPPDTAITSAIDGNGAPVQNGGASLQLYSNSIYR